jgi:hypothetical protein
MLAEAQRLIQRNPPLLTEQEQLRYGLSRPTFSIFQ